MKLLVGKVTITNVSSRRKKKIASAGNWISVALQAFKSHTKVFLMLTRGKLFYNKIFIFFCVCFLHDSLFPGFHVGISRVGN